jgi:predicted AAA+ superfamily ATPase
MTDLENILTNVKVNQTIIKHRLMHPILKTKIKPRADFDVLKKCAVDFFTHGAEPRMIGLSGLRGTGKTTLLWQTAEYIYENITTNIHFFNVNTLNNYNTNIRDILELLQTKTLKTRFSEYSEPIVLLFDEVHEDSMWTNSLKIVYDELKTAFVIATGSSALLLQSTADLATRMLIRHVFPLNFVEYLSIRHVKEEMYNHNFHDHLKQILFYSKDIKELENGLKSMSHPVCEFFATIENLHEHIVKYIEFYNITRFCIYEETEFIADLIIDLFKRVILEDIPKMTGDTNRFLHSEKLLRRIAASDEINIQTLSQSIGLSQNEINENLDILVKAELLNILFPFGGIDSRINKAQKYYFMSSSIRKVILSPLFGKTTSDDLFAKLLEDIIVMYLKRIFKMDSIISFSSDTKQKNPDFIIETLKNPILLEVGINKTSTRQITKSKVDYRYGIIINSKIDHFEIRDNSVILPLKWFLLL